MAIWNDVLVKTYDYLKSQSLLLGSSFSSPMIISSGFVADETNVRAEYLVNGTSFNQNVDGSITPIEFSSIVVPEGKVFQVRRSIIYMEDSTSFASTRFGGIPALTNGWEFKINGVVAFSANSNKNLLIHMFDFNTGSIFGKEDKTMICRFSFDEFSNRMDGITIRAGETISTVVNDDLSGLDFLEIMIEGVYKDA